MSLKAILPKPVDIGREALIVVGGAILAALIVSQLPSLQAWIKAQWNGTPHPYDLNG
jgi:hypothetical protein